jgi:hypothetical protein
MKKATKQRRKRERMERLRERDRRRKREKKPTIEDKARRLVKTGKYTQEEIEAMDPARLVMVCSLFFPDKARSEPTIPVRSGVRGMFRSH